MGIAVAEPGATDAATEGFYPESDSGASPLWGRVPGEIRPDEKERVDLVCLATTAEQDAAIQKYLDAAKRQPGIYDLMTTNCVDHVREALKEGGIESSESMFPKGFMSDFRERYAPAE